MVYNPSVEVAMLVAKKVVGPTFTLKGVPLPLEIKQIIVRKVLDNTLKSLETKIGFFPKPIGIF